MNSTLSVIEYTQTQKAFLPLASVPCLVVCILLYRFGRAANPNPEFRFDRKIQFLNALATGLAFGQFLFHSYPETPGALGVLAAALFAMLCAEKLARVWHANYHYTAPAAGVQEIRHTVDMELMEERAYVNWKNMDAVDGSVGVWEYEDEHSEARRRNALAWLLYVVLLLYTILEGFELARPGYGNDPAARVGVFYVHKLLETALVFTTLIYALWQTSRRGRVAYFFVALAWFAALALSPLPVLVDMPARALQDFFDFSLTWILHSVLGGVLLWVAMMFARIDLRSTDARDTLAQLALLALGLGLTCMTSFFI